MNKVGRKSGGDRWAGVTPLSRLTRGCEIDPETECWVWKRQITRYGYGVMTYEGHHAPAHRVSYILFKGPIAAGLEIDHLCRNRACCNPGHLEAVTRGENLRRGATMAARRSAQTHCKRGHRFTPENTHVTDRGERGERICRKCRRAAQWGQPRGLSRDDAIAHRYPPDADYGRLTIEDIAEKVARL